MKRLLMVFVFVIMSCCQAWGAYEKSGIVYYPTDGDSFENIIAAVTVRGEECTVKLLHKSGASTPFEIDSGLTVPSYVALDAENGAVLDHSGVTLNINGPFKVGPKQYVTNSLDDITFGPDSVDYIYPEWGGAKADGSTDSYQALQDALDCQANGTFTNIKPIKLGAGDYVLSDGLQCSQYTQIIGDGWTTRLIFQDNLAAGTYGMLTFPTTFNSVYLSNFRMSGNDDNQSNSPTQYGIWFTPSDSHGLYNLFENLWVGDFLYSAVRVDDQGMRNSRFVNCFLKDSGGVEATASHNVYSTNMQNCLFDGCTIRTAKTGTGYGILFDGTSNKDNIINGCQFDENLTHAIYASNTGDRLSITNCEFFSNKSGAVYIDRDDHLLISNCTFRNNFADTNPDGFAIEVELCENPTIVGNTINAGNGDGIILDRCLYANVRENTIFNVSGVTWYGIYGDSTDYSTIADNTITNTQSHAIFLDDGGNNLISNNTIVDAGLDTDNTYTGILLDSNDADDNNISNNIIISTTATGLKYGIQIGNTAADNNIIKNNDIHAETAAILDSGVSNLILDNPDDIETKSSSGGITKHGITYIDSNSGVLSVTMSDATVVGQRKIVGMSDASNASTLSVSSHETSDPEEFGFNATTDWLELEWTGSQWITIKNSGVATP